MLNFLRSGTEFNNLAKAMNRLNIMLDSLMRDIERSSNKKEFSEGLLLAAFIAKKGIIDRLEKYGWTEDTKIVVPAIPGGRIKLEFALSFTMGKLAVMSSELMMSDVTQDILNGGSSYFELEKKLPDHIKNDF
jgi:hypothetical protein